jgi:hypothetical protein
MVLAGVELRSVAIVPRDDSAQPLFALDLALVRGYEIRSKNLVPNIDSLVRAFVIIVCKPLAVDVVKLVEAYTEKVVQALALNFSNVAFTERIRHRSAHGCLDDFCSRSFPELVELGRILRIPVANKIGGPNAQILQPHGGITGLLKNPFFIGIKRGRTHEDPAATEVDKYQNISINPSSPSKDGFGEKVSGDQRIHMGAEKQLSVARRTSSALVRDRMVPPARLKISLIVERPILIPRLCPASQWHPFGTNQRFAFRWLRKP